MRNFLLPFLLIFAIGLFTPACGGDGGGREAGEPDTEDQDISEETTDLTDDGEDADLNVVDCIPGDGTCPGIGEELPGDWVILQPRFVVQPATPITLETRGIDVAAGEIAVWRDDDVLIAPRMVRIIEEGGDLETFEDDVVAVEVLVPYVEEGRHTLALGTVDERRSGRAVIEVVFPADIPSQEEVATRLRDGLLLWTGVIADITETDEPELRAFFDGLYTGEQLAQIETIVAGSREMADVVYDDYMALTPEEHRIAAVILTNSGVLEQLDGGDEALGSGGTGFVTFDDINNHVIHQALYEMDFAVMSLNVLDGALNVAEAITIVTGVGAAITAAIGSADVVLTILRVFIDNFVPTDLAALEVTRQAYAYPDEGVHYAIWGTFESEKPTLAGGFDAAIGFSLKAVSQTLPIRVDSKIWEDKIDRIAGLLAQMLGKISSDLVSAFSSLDQTGRVRAKTLINTHVYGLSLNTFSVLVPVFGPILALITRFVDYEFDSAFDLDENGGIPGWADGLAIDYGGGSDLMAVTDVPAFPDGVESFPIMLQINAYAWKTEPASDLPFLKWLPVDIPAMEDVFAAGIPIEVRPRPDSPEILEQEDFVITEVKTDKLTETHDGWMTTSTIVDRSYTLELTELTISSTGDDPTVLEVQLNGNVIDTVELPNSSTPVQVPLELDPNLNEVTITVIDGRANPGGLRFPAEFTVGFPEAANTASEHRRSMEVGETTTVRVWAPPEAPSSL